MIEQNTENNNILIIPNKTGSFQDMWRELSRVEKLLVPFSKAEVAGDHFVTKGPLFAMLFALLHVREQSRLGMVYTDRQLFDERTMYAKLPVEYILQSFLHSKERDGIIFNQSSVQEAIISKIGIARLLGLLKTKTPDITDADEHAQQAEIALIENRVLEAFYHSVAAREGGANLDNFYFVELECLFHLTFYKQASDYLKWYQSRGTHIRYRLSFAYGLCLAGKADEAFRWLDELLDEEEYAADAYYLIGFAWFKLGNPDAALEAFKSAITRNPDHIPAHLGKGIMLRNTHYQSSNKDGLEEATESLQIIVAKNGYHKAEALHLLCTIAISLEKWKEAEDYVRENIAIRDTKISRRNLIIALHAQSKIEEAKKEYEVLLTYAPEEAEHVKRLFK